MAGGVITVISLAACAPASHRGDPQAIDAAADAAPQTFNYSGQTVPYQVPNGVSSLAIVASGGSGGQSNETYGVGRSAGAEVAGAIAVKPGQQLYISVGGQGHDANSHDNDPAGGWGGVNATGGKGNAASDDLRTSAAGGGATTIEIADADGGNRRTILVSGGGGGSAGPSGDPEFQGRGGNAGCTGDPDSTPGTTPSWTGSNGSNGSAIKGGKGGTAAAQPGGAGARGLGGSSLGGNGGGGGGGVNGGHPGTGADWTSGGGGGGAGSSAVYEMTDTNVTCHFNSDNYGSGDGQVTVSAS